MKERRREKKRSSKENKGKIKRKKYIEKDSWSREGRNEEIKEGRNEEIKEGRNKGRKK